MAEKERENDNTGNGELNPMEMIFRDTKELVKRTISHIEKKHETHGAVIDGIPTGFGDIDKFLGGLPYGITLVGARPEDGLIDFGLNIANHVAFDSSEKGYKVAYFSPQIPAKILMHRLMCSRSRLNMQNVNEGFLADRDFPKITKAADKILGDRLLFYDGKLDAYDFGKACEQVQDKKGVGLIVLDRLQSLFTSESSSGESYYWKAKEIAETLHTLVSERGLALLVLSEVKKKKIMEEITTSHLRDWGVFEYGTGPIILLERVRDRGEYYEEERDAYPMQARITNNLRGVLNTTVQLTYLKEYGRFESAAKVDTGSFSQ